MPHECRPPPSPDKARRSLVLAPLAAPLSALPAAAWSASPKKVLRVAFSSAETSFDPARIIDLYSRTITSHIFESLYRYDHLARPAKFRPLLADGMPEVSADFKVWTVRLRRGIRFADDPAFKGQPRELQAADVLYPFKRLVDPANKSPASAGILQQGILGLAQARQLAIDGKKPFDYDAPIEGLQVLDPHTVRFVLTEPRPRFIQTLAANDLAGAQAREVVEHYGDTIGAHPVGTGPFRLGRWVRASKIVMERNPHFREEVYDADPAVDDLEGQALLARFKGRRLPMVDEVEVSVIEENQPLYLSFMNGQLDGLVSAAGPLPLDFATQVVPNGRLAPNLARRGIQLYRTVRSDMAVAYFNMEDPLLGGYTPEKVALRRAISLSYDVDREITLVRRGQAIAAQSPIVPGTTGYDPAFRSEMADHDPRRANALLDLYGYVDRDGDGWRETPDGRPMVIRMATEPEQIYRDFNELWRRAMKTIGIKVEFAIAQWPANMKSALAGSLQMWMLGSSADVPDGQSALQRMYGPAAGQQNLARFKLPAFDAIYERMLALPDSPQRLALFHEAKRIAAAYMPYKVFVHRIANDVAHPWMVGYRRPLFWNNWWHMVDVDVARRPAA
jgi:ABC-type transport system substrate-binding protein